MAGEGVVEDAGERRRGMTDTSALVIPGYLERV